MMASHPVRYINSVLLAAENTLGAKKSFLPMIPAAIGFDVIFIAERVE